MHCPIPMSGVFCQNTFLAFWQVISILLWWPAFIHLSIVVPISALHHCIWCMPACQLRQGEGWLCLYGHDHLYSWACLGGVPLVTAPRSLAQWLLRQYFWTWVIIMPICSCVAEFCAQLGYIGLSRVRYWTLPIHALPNTYDWGILSQLCCTGARLSLCFVLWCCIHVGRFHVSLLVPCPRLMFGHCMLYIDKFYSILT